MFTLANTKALVRAILKQRRKPVIDIKDRATELYLSGFVEVGLKSSEKLSETLRTLKALSDGAPRPPYFFEQKAPQYFFLRPEAFDYSRAFEELIFENDVPQLLEEMTGVRMCLANVTVLKHMPGIVANTEWHRDTHFLLGRLVGPMPPAIKVYFYPTLEKAAAPRVSFIKGSNRIDPQWPVLEQLYIAGASPTTISSSDGRFVVFDTTTLHRAIPDTDPQGSMRLLYTFYRLKTQAQKRHPANLVLHDRYAAGVAALRSGPVP